MMTSSSCLILYIWVHMQYLAYIRRISKWIHIYIQINGHKYDDPIMYLFLTVSQWRSSSRVRITPVFINIFINHHLASTLNQISFRSFTITVFSVPTHFKNILLYWNVNSCFTDIFSLLSNAVKLFWTWCQRLFLIPFQLFFAPWLPLEMN